MTGQPSDSEPAQNSSSASDPEATAPRPSPRLLEFLVCPVTKTILEISGDRSELISRAARLAYPIRDGIPMLTTETARELTDDDDRN